MYLLADLVKFTRLDILLKIDWENNSISSFFLMGRSLISSSNFARVATRANLISLVENLESKDDRSSSIFLPVSFSSLYFFSLRLISLMLTQLIRYAGNLVDFWGLSRSSCWANYTINNNDDNKDSSPPSSTMRSWLLSTLMQQN